MVVTSKSLKSSVSLFKYCNILILSSIILHQTHSHNQNRHSVNTGKRYPSAKNTSEKNTCGLTYNLTITTPVQLSSPNFGKPQYPPNLKCNWTTVGSSECKPSISCKTLDLRETPDCTKDYLEIYDGLGGYDRFCGNEKVVNLHSKGNSRYMFVNFVSDADENFQRNYEGIQCEVSCNTGQDELPVPEPPITEDPTCVCGMQGQKKGDRIVNGENAQSREFPWLVAIVVKGTRSPLCGASIINRRWVLSAAHCFASEEAVSADKIEILANARILNSTYSPGATNTSLGQVGSIRGRGWELPVTSDKDENSLRIKVTQIITHPLFSSNYDFDVALLELEMDIDFRAPDAPKPICLPTIADLKNLYKMKKPIVAGWGLPHETAGATTRILQKLEVPVIDPKECHSLVVDWEVTERMICAGYKEGGKDSCTGDSGGPLVLEDPTTHQWTQIGIVSWGEGCARKNSPGFYVRVTEFIQWIQMNTWNGIWCTRKSKLNF